jgi:hypothetical protein
MESLTLDYSAFNITINSIFVDVVILVMESNQDADKEQSIIANVLAQLRKGTELSRISLPTFVLEPRSMCERISDFLSHQDILFEYVTLKLGSRRIL